MSRRPGPFQPHRRGVAVHAVPGVRHGVPTCPVSVPVLPGGSAQVGRQGVEVERRERGRPAERRSPTAHCGTYRGDAGGAERTEQHASEVLMRRRLLLDRDGFDATDEGLGELRELLTVLAASPVVRDLRRRGLAAELRQDRALQERELAACPNMRRCCTRPGCPRAIWPTGHTGVADVVAAGHAVVSAALERREQAAHDGPAPVGAISAEAGVATWTRWQSKGQSMPNAAPSSCRTGPMRAPCTSTSVAQRSGACRSSSGSPWRGSQGTVQHLGVLHDAAVDVRDLPHCVRHGRQPEALLPGGCGRREADDALAQAVMHAGQEPDPGPLAHDVDPVQGFRFQLDARVPGSVQNGQVLALAPLARDEQPISGVPARQDARDCVPDEKTRPCSSLSGTAACRPELGREHLQRRHDVRGQSTRAWLVGIAHTVPRRADTHGSTAQRSPHTDSRSSTSGLRRGVQHDPSWPSAEPKTQA